MNGRDATKAEAEWIEKSKQIPCLVCKLYHNIPDTPAEYHHIDGQTKPGAHFKGFSLCARHHRIKDNQSPPRWISRHGSGRVIFEARYMPEGAFLVVQQELVRQLEGDTV